MKVIVLNYYFKSTFRMCMYMSPFLFAGTNQVKIYVTASWRSQIKTAGAAIYAYRQELVKE